jgi:hypothetical protein
MKGQYHAGEKVEASLNFLHGDRVRKVTVTFVHAEDPDTEFHLSGTPEEQVATEGAGYTYWRVVLSGVEAEYPGRRKVAFGSVPDVGFQITEENIQPPEVVDWEWGAGSR